MAALYLDEVAYRGSPKTAANCTLEIERRFVPYIERMGVKDIRDVTRAHCTGFISGEVTRGMGRSSVRKSFDVMRRWLNWCVDGGYLDVSPAAAMKPPKTGKPLRQAYTREEAKRLIEAAGQGAGMLAKRDRALVLLLLGVGARAAEALALTAHDLRTEDYRRNRRLKLHGKGSKERYVPVGKVLARALADWLAARPNVPTDALWTTIRNTPMSYAALAKMLERLGEYADVDNCIAHRFRHTYATEHYMANRDLMALKAALGHEEVATTEQYLRALGVDFALAARYPSPDEWLGR